MTCFAFYFLHFEVYFAISEVHISQMSLQSVTLAAFFSPFQSDFYHLVTTGQIGFFSALKFAHFVVQ